MRFPWAREYVYEIGLSSEEIQEMWIRNRDEAANRGTWMHMQFEWWLNRCIVPEESPEMKLFLTYIETLTDLTAFRTEWAIYGEEERLAGMCFIFYLDLDFNPSRKPGIHFHILFPLCHFSLLSSSSTDLRRRLADHRGVHGRVLRRS